MVVPVYNERQNVQPLVQEVSAVMRDYAGEWELILVDDASSDGTAQVLEGLRSDAVRVIRLRANSGQSTAILVGLRASRFNAVATMDGDLQNDPRDLPRMLAHLGDADMVCGSRLRRQDNVWRRLVSRVANRIRSQLTGDGVSDTGCSLKVMTGEVADKMVFFRGAHRFMPALAQMEGFRVEEMPVSHRPRLNGNTKYGDWQRLKATLPDLLGFLWLKSRYAEYSAEEI